MKLSLLKYLGFAFLLLSLSCNSRSDRDSLSGYMSIKKFVDGDTFWVDDRTRSPTTIV